MFQIAYSRIAELSQEFIKALYGIGQSKIYVVCCVLDKLHHSKGRNPLEFRNFKREESISDQGKFSISLKIFPSYGINSIIVKEQLF